VVEVIDDDSFFTQTSDEIIGQFSIGFDQENLHDSRGIPVSIGARRDSRRLN
jgi:hypothetical protein